MSLNSEDKAANLRVGDAASTGCLLAVVVVIIATSIWFVSTYWPSSVVVEPTSEEREEEGEVPSDGQRSELIDRLTIDQLGKKGDLLDSDPRRT